MPEKFQYPERRSRASDPQQYRVYRMEREAIGARTYARLTRAAQRQIVASVCRRYRVKPPSLLWVDLGRWAAEWEEDVIRFSNRKDSSKHLLTLTHELAHHVHFHAAGPVSHQHEDHGPQFMACHMSILDVCRVIPVVGMRAICDAWGVRYYDPGIDCSLEELQRVIQRP